MTSISAGADCVALCARQEVGPLRPRMRADLDGNAQLSEVA